MLGSKLRVEHRLDGSVAIRFRNEYLRIEICTAPQRVAKAKTAAKPRRSPSRQSHWMQGFFNTPTLPLGKAIVITNATN